MRRAAKPVRSEAKHGSESEPRSSPTRACEIITAKKLKRIYFTGEGARPDKKTRNKKLKIKNADDFAMQNVSMPTASVGTQN
jgi:hypothetical protein